MGEYDNAVQTPSPHEEPLDPERYDTAGVVFPEVAPEEKAPGDWRTDWANSPEATETRQRAEAYRAEQLDGGTTTTTTTTTEVPADSDVYDPGEHVVADVVSYVEANPDQLDAVYAAEEAGQARSTLLTQLDGMR